MRITSERARSESGWGLCTHARAMRALRLSTAVLRSCRTKMGISIPAPSGRHPVGCVDLIHQVRSVMSDMHATIYSAPTSQFEGDDHGGLLVRLFYPAQLNSSQPRNSPSAYAPWTSHKKSLQRHTHAIHLHNYTIILGTLGRTWSFRERGVPGLLLQ